MAKIIEFYIPSNFRRDTGVKKISRQERGQLIEFAQFPKKSA
jgi:hypothetical protein